MDVRENSQAKTHEYGNIHVSGGHAILGNAYIQQHDCHHDNVKDIRKHLQESLQFAEIDLRYDTVSDAHRRTFEWLFGERKEIRRWDNFVDWLETGQEPYLIEGKPGSGKSTLMRFICRHRKLQANLRVCSNGKAVLTIYHFFWLAGSELQRSFKGLLATLAFQLVEACSDKVLEALPEKYTPRHSRPKSELKHWSEADLESLIMLCLNTIDCVIFILIDALDEFDHNEQSIRLVAYLQELNAYPFVKLCISSRPLIWLDQSFASAKKLLLHELTKEDIRKYATEILDQDFQFYASDLTGEKEAILQVITSKSEGIFLWVKYALSSLRDGVIAFDDAKSLRQRLEELPKGMEGLFQHMWQRHENSNERHREETARFLGHGRLLPMSLFDFTVATNPKLQEHYLSTSMPVDEDLLIEACNSTRKKLMVRTAGLLVCQRSSSKPYFCSLHRMKTFTPDTCFTCSQEHKSISATIRYGNKRSIYTQRFADDMAESKVNYLHRTVHHFLWETRFGLSLVTHSSLSPKSISLLRLLIGIANVLQNSIPLDPKQIKEWIELVECIPKGVLLIHDIFSQLEERLPVATKSSWFYKMQISHGRLNDFYTDLMGFICHIWNSDFNYLSLFKSILHSRKPSAFYKGYLLCCAISDGLSRGCLQDDLITLLIGEAATLFRKYRIATDPYNADVFALSALDRVFQMLFLEADNKNQVGLTTTMELLAMMLPRIPKRATVMVPVLDFRSIGWEVATYSGGPLGQFRFELYGSICVYCHIYVHQFYSMLSAAHGELHYLRIFDSASLIANIEYVIMRDSYDYRNEDFTIEVNPSAIRVDHTLEQFLLTHLREFPRFDSGFLDHALKTVIDLSRHCPVINFREELIARGYIIPVAIGDFVPPSLDDRWQRKPLTVAELFDE